MIFEFGPSFGKDEIYFQEFCYLEDDLLAVIFCFLQLFFNVDGLLVVFVGFVQFQEVFIVLRDVHKNDVLFALVQYQVGVLYGW